ncbi:STAS/SEC14 domain-containing protein [Jannaschia sp. S6380]|uniref:STAS/SEC14 domain-containing protein n=1 Tax=Jannaschia sp. S6380 TaxID=2926408 RepID=UPI001FF4A0B2|nr:STAS/SEC14 domain-containing protein [Jannaschia sp. S6380]MCK0167943.1 STAS/SEC14 domain-containing protein [Jannaschia sp. S6380]
MPQTIHRIAAEPPTVYAFEITGEVAADDMEAMADTMNAAFDAHDKVSMLLIFDDFRGSETGAGFDWSSIKSRFRSLANVEKYATVGAPGSAETMIAAMGKVIPVEARTFDPGEIHEAWAYVGARPV